MFPGGRPSQNMPGGKSGYPSSYYRDVAAVSNPSWFGNNPTPVPPPVQYPSRTESGRDLLAESYERMRNEMRSLQSNSTSKYGGGASAPPAPAMEEKANPLTQLLENKDVSLSSLLEAAMDPSIGSSKRKEDPIMKKTILDKCEGKIAQLYRLRISGQGMFFPMTQPKTVKFDGVSTLTYNHPRIEFNMYPEEPVWTCPDVIIETKKEEPAIEKNDEPEGKEDEEAEEQNAQKEREKDRNSSNPLDKIEALEPQSRQLPTVAQQQQRLQQRQQQQQQQQLQQQQLLQLIKQPPPVQSINKPPPTPVENVSYPNLSQYRATLPRLMDNLGPYTVPPPVIPNSGQLPMDVWAEMEKERRRKEIEIEWDRLMQDKERKEKKRKKKKKSRSRSRSSSSGRSGSRRSKSRRSRSRYRSHSRGRSSHRRSHSRHRSRGRSRDRRYRHRSRSLSLSPSPPRKQSRSPLRIRYRRSPSPRVRRRSSSFLRSLHHELMRSPPRLRDSPPRYRHSPPPRLREEYPHGPPQMHPYGDVPLGPPSHLGPLAQPGPPGYGSYYEYGSGSYPPNPPPPGMDDYGPPYGAEMPPYGPMGPGPHGPHPGPWMDQRYGPPMRGPGPGGRGPGPGGPGPWMGPGPGPRWFGPRPPMGSIGPMGPRGPMPPNTQRPPMGPVGPPPPTVPDKIPTKNLIDLTSRTATTSPAQKKPVVIVDITDESDKPTVSSAEGGGQKVEASKSKPEPGKLEPAAGDESKEAEKPKPPEKLVVNKAKVISNIIPPGVSPDRETHTKYPNVESEFTRPMRAQFRKMLEPLDKILDKIRLYQRDSFDFKTIIKSLESGKIEFMGVHTLHDGLLCKLEINRKQPDKFFKIVVPSTHVGRVLRAIHSTYHDYSIGRIQRFIEDLFCDPRQFPLGKIVSVIKQCKECIAAEQKERESLRKKEILILGSPERAEVDRDEVLTVTDNVVGDPMVKTRKERQRQRSPEREDKDKKRQKVERSRRPSDAEKDGKSRRDGERDRTEKSRSERGELKNKPQRKSPPEGADTYSKFEDLSVSRKTDETEKSPNGENKPTGSVGEKGGNDVAKKAQPDIGNTTDGKADEKGEESFKDDKKQVALPAGTGKVVSKKDEVQVSAGKVDGKSVGSDGKNDRMKEGVSSNQSKPISLEKSIPEATVANKESADSIQSKSASKLEQKPAPKPQQKPIVNPDDFKERVRAVQMGVDPLGSQISDLEGLGKKSSDPALVLKAGMLCRRLPPPKGQGKPEVKIVVTPACIKEMVEIVHTMAALHAPFQKTVTVFNKHFVPIDGLEKAVSEVLNVCAKCSSDVKKK